MEDVSKHLTAAAVINTSNESTDRNRLTVKQIEIPPANDLCPDKLNQLAVDEDRDLQIPDGRGKNPITNLFATFLIERDKSCATAFKSSFSP